MRTFSGLTSRNSSALSSHTEYQSVVTDVNNVLLMQGRKSAKGALQDPPDDGNRQALLHKLKQIAIEILKDEYPPVWHSV